MKSIYSKNKQNRRVYILLVFLVFLLLTVGTSGAAFWSDSWSAYSTVDMNATPPEDESQVHFTDDTFTIPLAMWNEMDQTGKDTRILNYNHTTEFPFWIEHLTARDNYSIWVNVTDNTSASYQWYYGNTFADSFSNGDNTFTFFDDFEGNYEISNTWTRYASNPILSKNTTSGSWDYYFVNSPYIATYANGTAYQDGEGNYYMYYSGSGNADGRPFNDDRVGLALSTDLYNWTRADSVIAGTGHVGLVLDFGAGGTFDDSDVQIGSIIVDNGTFHMWYTGNDNSASDNLKFGYANSTDGKNWTKSPSNPILSYGTGDDNDGVYAPHVILDDSTWKMWYTGKNTVGSPVFGIMYATAPFATPTVWTRYSNDYVYEYNQVGNSMWGSYVWKDSINDYNMIFSNYDTLPYVFHWSNSTNGIDWTRQGVIFEEGASGQWDESYLLWVSQINVSGTWYSYYRATDSSDDHRIGVATSTNRLPIPKQDTEFSKWDSVGGAFSINDSIKYAGSYSALGTGHATAEERLLLNTITRTSGTIHVQYKPVVQSNYQNLVRIDDSSGTLYLVTAHIDGHYQYHDGSWNNFPVDTLWSIGRWDEIIVDFDYGTDKYNVTINGTKISGSGLTLQGAGTQTDSMFLATYNDVYDQNYFDNYFIREYIANEPIVINISEPQYYMNSLHYNASSPYNHTIESDGTITSNRSISSVDDTDDTARSTGTSHLIINAFDDDEAIVRSFTFTGDNLDWYQVANISGSYDMKNSGGIIETQTDGNFTTNLVPGTYWIEETSGFLISSAYSIPYSDTAYIMWTVDIPSSNIVEYSLYFDMSSSSFSTWDNTTTSPQILLEGLTLDTTYYYKMSSTFGGDATTSDTMEFSTKNNTHGFTYYFDKAFVVNDIDGWSVGESMFEAYEDVVGAYIVWTLILGSVFLVMTIRMESVVVPVVLSLISAAFLFPLLPPEHDIPAKVILGLSITGILWHLFIGRR